MKHLFKNTWIILTAAERKRFAILVVMSIVISVADILALIALLWIINFYIQPAANISLFLPGWLGQKDSPGLISLFLVLFALKNWLAYQVVKLHYAFTGDVAVRISQNNLQQFQHSSYHDYVNTDSSALIRKIALQPFEFCQHILSGWQQVITQLLLVGFAALAIIIFNPKLFLLLLLILVPPVTLVFFFIRKKMTITKKHLRENNERSYQYLLDALKGYMEGNIFQRNDFFLRRFLVRRKAFSQHLFHSLSLQNFPGRSMEVFAVLGLFMLITISKWLGYEDEHSLLTIGAFMAASYKIIPGMVKIVNLSGQIKAYEFRKDELSAEVSKIDDSSLFNVENSSIYSVRCSNVHFCYNGQPVLKNISFEINRGEMLGISGQSGIGKTTLLHLLIGLLEPETGTISINNKPCTTEERRLYWPAIAYCRQQPFFIYDSILKNITLEESGHDEKRLKTAIEVAGLDKVIQTFPEGIEKIVTENGKNISGGQQQRIMLARALYKTADLLLLDEPFNELDENAACCILKKCKELLKERIIILVTHDKKILSTSDKILSLDETAH